MTGFYETPKRRGAVVLTPWVLEQAQRLRDEGNEVSDVAHTLSIKPDTLRKAIAAGKRHQPQKKS